ncbi:hypothetical protein B0J17DRAFT_628574 [Rhizoctonia solani]|nr:hypothetical protein B0J17DRAFT_628574 [Rhizoctonia solani]
MSNSIELLRGHKVIIIGGSSVLQSLCSNPDGGYWCGDTAQTINVGSSFRIKDLKAFVYDSMPRWKRRYAASLVELIYTLFPTAIDVMAPESAKTPGLSPLLFISPDTDQDTFMHFLLDQKPIEEATPFGAQQAIIVRETPEAVHCHQSLRNKSRQDLTQSVSGLEFDDILLYNFFQESEAPTSAWRLYVAITRARHRCWIWDSGETIDAMKVFWEGLKLIRFSDSPTADLRQWAQCGRGLFSTGQYEQAQSCFEHAGQDKEATISDAYDTMTKAKATQGAGAEAALIHAANKMETSRDIIHASKAYCKGGLYDKAATIWLEAQNMDECLKILASYSDCMDVALVHRITEVASAHFLRERRYEDLQKLLKGDLDPCIALARSLQLPTQVKELLQRGCRFEYLENECLSDRFFVQTIECPPEVQKPAAIERAKNVVSSYLWTIFSLDDPQYGCYS